jgi:uridine kinase
MQSIFVAIAGGSGSGKTTVVRRVLETFASRVVCIDMDSYYKDLAHLTLPERRRVNFDHPDAFDTGLMVEHIKQLRAGQSIQKPVYDFSRSTRETRTVQVDPAPIVVVEGILVLAEPQVRDLCDARIFVDTDGDIRFIRRLQRDVAERGRTMESVISQYTHTVRPMHDAFVEPSKRWADIIIPHGGKNEIAIRMVIADLRARLEQSHLYEELIGPRAVELLLEKPDAAEH